MGPVCEDGVADGADGADGGIEAVFRHDSGNWFSLTQAVATS
jgi:hypothetical protein